ncbi:hypothetical protein PGT21_004904 [Puccinia graminis f. sp. tritici]|uniref:Uncharacterized protein n=1 Tax=Puccinia graminis f. sp. tritici TaxID=56615 RepID=A0A5B0PWW3_PUCGR|nr:hypothetical protein PGTUg99_022967 [Puccinia graminis f. sp. tritici]KAA1105376.1 hypothetical protein PGT21_004904 [Puccinia graminis f. sp. tritici]
MACQSCATPWGTNGIDHGHSSMAVLLSWLATDNHYYQCESIQTANLISSKEYMIVLNCSCINHQYINNPWLPTSVLDCSHHLFNQFVVLDQMNAIMWIFTNTQLGTVV